MTDIDWTTEAADDLRTEVARLEADRDQWKARAEAAEHLLALGQRQIDEKAADRIATLEAALRIANTGGLDLLYAIREAIGWTDKHALSLLPDECRRLKSAASRKSHGWPGEDYDHSQPGGFDGPTGAD